MTSSFVVPPTAIADRRIWADGQKDPARQYQEAGQPEIPHKKKGSNRWEVLFEPEGRKSLLPEVVAET